MLSSCSCVRVGGFKRRDFIHRIIRQEGDSLALENAKIKFDFSIFSHPNTTALTFQPDNSTFSTIYRLRLNVYNLPLNTNNAYNTSYAYNKLRHNT